jgi:hypothetical protein
MVTVDRTFTIFHPLRCEKSSLCVFIFIMASKIRHFLNISSKLRQVKKNLSRITRVWTIPGWQGKIAQAQF